MASTYARCFSRRETAAVIIMVYTHAAVKLRRCGAAVCAGLSDGALCCPPAMAARAGSSAASLAAVSPIYGGKWSNGVGDSLGLVPRLMCMSWLEQPAHLCS